MEPKPGVRGVDGVAQCIVDCKTTQSQNVVRTPKGKEQANLDMGVGRVAVQLWNCRLEVIECEEAALQRDFQSTRVSTYREWPRSYRQVVGKDKHHAEERHAPQ